MYPHLLLYQRLYQQASIVRLKFGIMATRYPLPAKEFFDSITN